MANEIFINEIFEEVIVEGEPTLKNIQLIRTKFGNKAIPVTCSLKKGVSLPKGVSVAFAKIGEQFVVEKIYEKESFVVTFLSVKKVKINNKEYKECLSTNNITFYAQDSLNVLTDTEYFVESIKSSHKRYIVNLACTFNATIEVNSIFYQDPNSHYKIFSGDFIKIDAFPENNMPIFEVFSPYVNKGDEFSIKAFWAFNNKKKCTIIPEYMKRTFSDGNKSLVKFLTSSIKGLGKKKATSIVKEFGDDSIDVIVNNPFKLIKLKGISQDIINDISCKIVNAGAYHKLFSIMSMHGFSNKEIGKVFNKFEVSAITIFEENVYDLSPSRISEKLIDKVAKNLNYAFNDKRRVKHFILSFLKYESISKGDLFTLKSDIVSKLNKYVKSKGVFETKELITESEIEKCILELNTAKKIIIDNDDIYLRFNFYIQKDILNRMDSIKNYIYFDKYEESFIKDNIPDVNNMDEKQVEAIVNGINNSLSVITGGPGTGKTHTINNLIKTIRNIKKTAVIQLAAPTGKAAKRMTEQTGIIASTIHRLLGIKPYDEVKNGIFFQLKPLICDYLIVDESSMIDAELFSILLNCVQENTKIIFVGDYNQLPPVGIGLVFRDIINSGEFKVTKLTKVYRQKEGSDILKLASDIMEEKEIKYPFSKLLNSDDIIGEIKEKINQGKIKSMEDFIVLTPMNKGEFGTFKINYLIQREFNKSFISFRVGTNKIFKVNDKVIQVVNDYDLGVFNGDTGVITSINEKEETISVDFGAFQVEYDKSSADGLSLAYAITVHKSQGSEYKNVFMLVDPRSEFMLSKNLLYTGVTRASENLELFGSKEAFQRGCRLELQMDRKSRILDGLRGDYSVGYK